MLKKLTKHGNSLALVIDRPILDLLKLDNPVTEGFGKQCLLARRMVERGVRFIQLYRGSIVNQNVDTWDAHASIVDNHSMHDTNPGTGAKQWKLRSGVVIPGTVVACLGKDERYLPYRRP